MSLSVTGSRSQPSRWRRWRPDSGGMPAALPVTVVLVAALVAVALYAARTVLGYSWSIACRADKQSTQDASAAYFDQHDRTWADSVDDLISGGYLAQKPGGFGYTVTYHNDGTVTAAGACT